MNEKTVERRQPGWTTIKIKPPLKGKGFIREVALSQLSSSLITVWWCLAKSALGQKKISRLLSTCCERFFNPLRSSWFIHSDASLSWKVFLKMVQTSLPFKIFFLTISIPLVSCCSSTRYVCFFFNTKLSIYVVGNLSFTLIRFPRIILQVFMHEYQILE